MSLPTLLIKGKLVPPGEGKITKAELDQWVPLDYIINWFKERQKQIGMKSRVLILKSETASGKSTALPPAIFRHLVYPRQKNGKAPGMICTQPRVITAIKNLSEILNYNSDILKLGENTGWSTKYNKFKPRGYGLLSATIGTLAQQLLVMTDDEICAAYSYILIDETHERDLTTDMTILMLKNLLERLKHRIDCPFVALMSATFDPLPFIKYFGLELDDNFIWCRGETAGFTEMWDWNEGRTVNNFAQSAAEIVERITMNEISASASGTDTAKIDIAKIDILIFLPGAKEFLETAMYLEKLNKKLSESNPKWVFSIIKIDSVAVNNDTIDYKNLSLELSSQMVVFGDRKLQPIRRVIMSTNVAETGLTLPNLKYVIDAGLNREVEYNPVYGLSALITKPAPQSRITQRRGRAGRKFPGVFYPLYPKYIFEMLPKNQHPQILTSDISPIVLSIIIQQLKSKKMKNLPLEFRVDDIDMITIPSPDALLDSINKLYSIGLLTNEGFIVGDDGSTIQPTGKFGLTKLGILSSKFGLMRPEICRMILAAYSWKVNILDMCSIAAYISMDLKDFTPAGKPKKTPNWDTIYKDGAPAFLKSKQMTPKMRLVLGDSFIDGLIMFNAIRTALVTDNPDNLQIWCTKVNLPYDTILKFIAARDSVIEQMLSGGFDVFTSETELRDTDSTSFMNVVTRIKHCIYDGFRCNLLIYEDGYRYKGVPVVGPKLFQDIATEADYKNRLAQLNKITPKYVLFNNLGIKYNQKTELYSVYISNHYCTLDGFVSVDLDFTN